MEKKLKKLPLSKQTFKDLIKENMLYVDKTEEIYKLIENGSGCYFLSRPRRFGKSLLITTLEEIFLGNKEFFKNLWIYDKIEFKKYPVIKLKMNDLNYVKGIKEFEESLLDQLNDIYKKYKVKRETENYKIAFKNLIHELAKKTEQEKVVLLIDEYDKPIIEHLGKNNERAKEMRDILKNFYETIKANDEYLYFVLLTGVSKFSKTSVFSTLNNINDITIDKKYSQIVGINEEQLYNYFDEYIKILAKKEELSIEETKIALKKWYNGYSWDGVNFLYNPYSLINTFDAFQIKNYWFQSGTPTFLIKMIRKYNLDIKKLDNLLLYEKDFDSYEVDKMNVESLLFQTGYLTIKEIEKRSYSDRRYKLAYPNMEVKDSLLNYLLDDFVSNNESNGVSISYLVDSLKNKDLKEFFTILKSIFASIPNQIFPEKTTLTEKESYYHTIFHIIFTIMGTNIKSEVSVSRGRIDSVIETDDRVYIFEFKVGRSPRKAIEQIVKKDYTESYKASKKEIVKIGVNFSITKRNIKNFEIL